MSVCATITVTSGPDRGKVFELTAEMVRLGKAAENEVVLSDAQVGDHHASIVRRDGRYAIFTSEPGGLEIDGTEVPAERWVWLPETATIHLGKRTVVDFAVGGGGEEPALAAAEPAGRQFAGRQSTDKFVAPAAAPAAEAPATRPPGTGSTGTVVLPGARSGTQKGRRSTEVAAPGSDAPARPRKSAAERGEKKTRTVARFITDGPGDPLVKLGEDGHLPELALHETQAGERTETGTKQSNPALLLVAIGLSFGLTILMLFMDVGSFGDSEEEKAKARAEIAVYYGEEGDSLKPYQIHLREARLARSRRDYDTERQEYRKVLGLLRSEAKDKLYKYTGLTGRLDYDESTLNKKSDKRLEELIGTLLSE
ncbi:MAG: FHA domain-containing protein [Deltaproteobacteria bacterium]